jgi:hypothetical protein
MEAVLLSALARWANFYVIVGSSVRVQSNRRSSGWKGIREVSVEAGSVKEGTWLRSIGLVGSWKPPIAISPIRRPLLRII